MAAEDVLQMGTKSQGLLNSLKTCIMTCRSSWKPLATQSSRCSSFV